MNGKGSINDLYGNEDVKIEIIVNLDNTDYDFIHLDGVFYLHYNIACLKR